MLQVLHSSAGSGKTHALVKRYVLLALQQDHRAYRNILALTFTNKAAAEMKDRVLLYLRQLADQEFTDQRIADLLAALKDANGIGPEEATARAQAVLRDMLHHWSDLSITTIDAFVRRLVKPFTRDLKLDQDLRMSTDQKWYRQRAIELVLDAAGRDHALTDVLVKACERLVEDEARWQPTAPFEQLVGELDQEQAIRHLATLKQMDAAAMLRAEDRLNKAIRAFRKEVNDMGQHGLLALRNAGLEEGDLARKGAIFTLLKRMAAFPAEDIKLTPTTEDVAREGRWASTKASRSARVALDGLADMQRGAVEAVRRWTDDGSFRDHQLRIMFRKELMATGALCTLSDELEVAKREDGVTFFQDLTRAVERVVRDEPVPFLYERLGQRYRHFLIDEFQDTSVMQWHALLPLAENALSNGGSVFLVGDAKQAIYRWRNGEVRQFKELPAIHGRELLADGQRREQFLRSSWSPLAPLRDNHRSSATIVELNNRLFDQLRQLLPVRYQPVYDDQAQEARKPHGGLVHLEVAPKLDPAGATETWSIAWTVDRIQECIADGHRPGDIAVLVRSRDKGQQVALAITAAGFDVVSPDGLRLSSDAAVDLVLALLRLDMAPSRSTALQALAAGVDAGLIDQALLHPPADPHHGNAMERVRKCFPARPRASSTLLDRMLGHVHSCGLNPATDLFLNVLLDAVREHQQQHGHDPAGFLEHWERAYADRAVSIPAGKDAVKVMTIHKAKGLQFPVVILPSTNMGSDAQSVTRLWIDPSSIDPELRATLITYKGDKAPDVPEVREETELKALDRLDLLYVAFTRPEQRLYAVVPSSRADTLSDGIRAYIEAHEKGGSDRLVIGERQLVSSKEEASPKDAFLLPIAPGGGAELLVRTTAPDNGPVGPDERRRMGDTLHDLLARVQTVDDLDMALTAAVAKGELGPAEHAAWRPRLEALLNREDLRPWYGEGLQVITETPIINPGDRSARPDRVVRDANGWRVLDIKTGSPHDAHGQQVRGYMELLRNVTGAPVQGALLYLASGTLEPVA